jgi:DNA gyrase subunit B
MKKGKQEWYVTDQKDYDRFILENGIGRATVKTPDNGAGLSGVRLIELMEKLLRFQMRYEKCLKIGFPRRLLDDLLESRMFCTCHFDDTETAIQVIEEAVRSAGYMIDSANISRVHEECGTEEPKDGVLIDVENVPLGRIDDYSITVSGNIDGQIIQYTLMKNTLSSIDFLNMYELKRALKTMEKFPVTVYENGEGAGETAASFAELVELAARLGRKGLTVQRYKGLGEMNPEQLWSTTMNPETRTLYKVNLEDVVEADRIFTILMGDEVEPRRKFIQENAFNVRNLDV